MRQIATVDEVFVHKVRVSVRRESACSGDCHKCAGCGAVTQTLQITADNPIGAQKGDRVYVESSTATVLWAAVLVYLLPIVCFLSGYAIGTAVGYEMLIAAMAFLLGWLPAVCYNRYVKKRPPSYILIGFVE